MISTKPKEENAEVVFQQYIKLTDEDRSEFMNKVTRWLTQRVEEHNKEIKEKANSK